MHKKLTLTFDNGPHPQGTPLVLKTLAEYRLLANFFPIGEKISAPGGEALVKSVKEAGHRVGIHTLTHSLPLGLGAPGFARHEIIEGQARLGQYGESPPLFRPYAGKGLLGPHVLNQEAVEVLQQQGFSLVLWNSVPRDWELPTDAWVARALDDLANNNWTVMVLHDARPEAMEHLGHFIEQAVLMDVEITQQLPDWVMPIQGGLRCHPFAALVAPTAD
ncbi:polysaccharide deacetylase family protein [Serratia proteamaculans]|uniref:polysaccharide deacetylase family protein n=1 Tax=Serratia proteamaculans TaxID=28151 RepID=UPI001C5A295E|nr:polysaccharide deacetylase family protein [Serratia proteamaculans]WEO92122.1 polysaccharide deacetylase family protein [Serratia proteamaculans]CAI0887132.1 Bifunctional xylanase/deacetylase precursor [Serratia proteamaculans]CAI1636527.1 Bifunctional xylanase/deacetylase precursor [Serratia proteamaculans]CAI1791739.1 Bifunctional xylanase/deacetylase precursor [Serratia proteamaculans]CAI1915339.1 Bifunctional xylanase/deacetylase precursor [Serratia proteamaculans]